MYKYYYRNRPPGIGCQPDGFDVDTREYWHPKRGIGGLLYHGQVSYPDPLDFEQVWRHELVPADPIENAEYIFWQEQETGSGTDLRDDYLNTSREILESLVGRDALARAALVILDAQEESEHAQEPNS